MAAPHDPTDPANMSPQERLAEVAAILAEGLLRLHRRAAISAPKIPSDSDQNCLDAGADIGPDGQGG